MLLRFCILTIILAALTGCNEQLQVHPDPTTVYLGQTTIFNAILYDRHHRPVPAPAFRWKAYNLDTREFEPISRDGAFTARMPGSYLIVAEGGGLLGYSLVTVPNGIVWNPNFPVTNCTNVSSFATRRSPKLTLLHSRGVPLTCVPTPLAILPAPGIRGPGWQDSNWQDAFAPATRVGHDPLRLQIPGNLRLRPHAPQFATLEDGAGIGNYQLSVPVLNLPGRGLHLSLGLTYNSKVWTRIDNNTDPSKTPLIVYDHDRGFPAAGWSLGFGKIVRMGSNGVALEDPDGTLHPFFGQVRTYGDAKNTSFDEWTADGTFIETYVDVQVNNGNLVFVSGQARYPNGTIIDYGASSNDAIYPTRITDRNGNYIKIAYSSDAGPQIDNIVDTLGRTIQFNYNNQNLLSYISAPAYRGAGLRTVVRFQYQAKTFNYVFSPSLNVLGPTTIVLGVKQSTPVEEITAIYFPGTSTGYWFGDADSYSDYGMIAVVNQQRNMGYSNSTVTPGAMTQETSYNYPTPDPTLTDAPLYTQTTQDWAGRDTAAASPSPPPVTTYSSHMAASPRTLDTYYPDGSHSHQEMINDPNQWDDGLLTDQELRDDSHGVVLSKVVTNWEIGESGAARIHTVNTIDDLGQTTQIAYGYNNANAQTDQLTDVRTSGFTGALLQHTHTDYQNIVGPMYVLNLPLDVAVYGPDASEASYTSYLYDQDATNGNHPYDTPGVRSHSDVYDPFAPSTTIAAHHEMQCDATDYNGHIKVSCPTVYVPAQTITDYQGWTDQRGNLTEVDRRSVAADKTSAIATHFVHDIDGNVVMSYPDCCDETVVQYSPEYEYAYPTSVTHGGIAGRSQVKAAANGSTPPPTAPPPTPAPPTPTPCPGGGRPPDSLQLQVPSPSISTWTSYDFSTGLVGATADANWPVTCQVTTVTYYGGALRPQQVTAPTGSTTNYAYDDSGMSVTRTTLDSAAALADESVSDLNGLGLPKLTKTLAPGSVWNAIKTEYDALGRTWQVSRPYRVDQPTLSFSVLAYDLLGRVASITGADGSKTLTCYDETSRPASAATCSSPIAESAPAVCSSPPAWRPDSALPACGGTVRTVDPMGRERWSRTDEFGNVVDSVEPPAYGQGAGTFSGTGSTDTAYSYNALNLLIAAIRGPDKLSRDFQYDSLGRMTAESLPEKKETLDDSGAYVGKGGHWTDVFTYDTHSNLRSHVDARGVKTVLDYATGGVPTDPLNRLQTVSYVNLPNGTTANVLPSPPLSYSYLTTGDVTQLYQVTLNGSPNEFERFGYDSRRRATSKTRMVGVFPVTQSVVFDSLNREKIVNYPVPSLKVPQWVTIDLSYDIGDALHSLFVNGTSYASKIATNLATSTSTITVGPDGSTQTVESYRYDPLNGNLLSQSVSSQSGQLMNLAYSYYLGGQLSESVSGKNCTINNTQGCKTRSYYYDGLGRLMQVQGAEPAPNNLNWSESYTFDSNSNETNVVATPASFPLDGYANRLYPSQNHIQGFTYDDAGNVTQAVDGKNTTDLTYDQADRIAQVLFNGGSPELYAYGPDSRRWSVQDGQTTTYQFWNGESEIADLTQIQGNPGLARSKAAVYLGNRRLATIVAGNPTGVLYQHPDRIGTRLITNSSDQSSIEQETLPFGTLMPSGSADPVNPVFTSYDRSSTTGLDYAINRLFDPGSRFLQTDPAGAGSTNSYAYAGNDPINNVDPTGLRGCKHTRCWRNGRGQAEYCDRGIDCEPEDYLLSAHPRIERTYGNLENLVGIDANLMSEGYVALGPSGMVSDYSMYVPGFGDVSPADWIAASQAQAAANLKTPDDYWAYAMGGSGPMTPEQFHQAMENATADVYTLGVEGTLTLPLLAQFGASTLIGHGIYYDTESFSFGSYTVTGQGPGYGAGGDYDVEFGLYPNLAAFEGKGLDIGLMFGAGPSFGLNLSFDTDTHDFVGGAIDVGLGAGPSAWALKTKTVTIGFGMNPGDMVSPCYWTGCFSGGP